VHDRRPRAARAWQMVHRRATPLPASPGRRSVAACARRSSLGRRCQAQPPAALPPHGCPVAAQPKILHTWHSGVRSTPSWRTIASPKSVTARSLGVGNLGLGATKVRRRGKMAGVIFGYRDAVSCSASPCPWRECGSPTSRGRVDLGRPSLPQVLPPPPPMGARVLTTAAAATGTAAPALPSPRPTLLPLRPRVSARRGCRRRRKRVQATAATL